MLRGMLHGLDEFARSRRSVKEAIRRRKKLCGGEGLLKKRHAFVEDSVTDQVGVRGTGHIDDLQLRP